MTNFAKGSEMESEVFSRQNTNLTNPKQKKSTPIFLTSLTNSAVVAAGRHCEEAGTPPHETNPYFYLLHCQRRRRTTCLLGLDTQFIVLLEK